MKCPEKVLIGPYEYTVVIDANEIHAANRADSTVYAGQIRYMEGRILVQPGQPANRVRETVLHETVHGILDVTALDDLLGENAESFIRRFSPMLLDTLRRNPALVGYLTSEEVPDGKEEYGSGRWRALSEDGQGGRATGSGGEAGPKEVRSEENGAVQRAGPQTGSRETAFVVRNAAGRSN